MCLGKKDTTAPFLEPFPSFKKDPAFKGDPFLSQSAWRVFLFDLIQGWEAKDWVFKMVRVGQSDIP